MLSNSVVGCKLQPNCKRYTLAELTRTVVQQQEVARLRRVRDCVLSKLVACMRCIVECLIATMQVRVQYVLHPYTAVARVNKYSSKSSCSSRLLADATRMESHQMHITDIYIYLSQSKMHCEA
jgi:hypothetical protein